MFRQRLMTAGVLIALFVAILLFSPAWLLCIVATLIILLASWEYLDMACAEQSAADRLLCLSLASLIPAAASSGRPECLYGALFASVFLLAVRAIASKRDLRPRFEELQLCLFGTLYVSLGLSHFLLLRNLEAWKPWIFTVLIVTYAGDVAAYASGTRWGRTKLSPLLSPKKTLIQVADRRGTLIYRSINLGPDSLAIRHDAVALNATGLITAQLTGVGDVADRRAPHVAHETQVVKIRTAMHGAAVIPHHQIIRPPAVRVHKLALRDMRHQLLE